MMTARLDGIKEQQREPIQIRAAFLRAVRENTLNEKDLIREGDLANHTQFAKYRDELLALGFIEAIGDSHYHATEKGRQALEKIEMILRAFGKNQGEVS
jgi:predicted transcriptional regulator